MYLQKETCYKVTAHTVTGESCHDLHLSAGDPGRPGVSFQGLGEGRHRCARQSRSEGPGPGTSRAGDPVPSSNSEAAHSTFLRLIELLRPSADWTVPPAPPTQRLPSSGQALTDTPCSLGTPEPIQVTDAVSSHSVLAGAGG